MDLKKKVFLHPVLLLVIDVRLMIKHVIVLEEMERMLADRIKNRFKPLRTQEKINYKKVWVEHNYQTNTLHHKNNEYT